MKVMEHRVQVMKWRIKEESSSFPSYLLYQLSGHASSMCRQPEALTALLMLT
jgi:hypothetical protein